VSQSLDVFDMSNPQLVGNEIGSQGDVFLDYAIDESVLKFQ
jgi:hypothetical protein